MKNIQIDKLLQPLQRFIHQEQASGIVLFASLVVAMAWVNSGYAHAYHELWETTISFGLGNAHIAQSLHHWINDGLMAVFFFVVGMELKREFRGGELSSPKKALLPIGAALGGMVVPALIYFLFNRHENSLSGWGIPMATDIAFAIGLLAFVSNKVPFGLKIFLTALAIADDLGAVIVIAFFYTSDLSLLHLGIGIFFFFLLIIGNIIGIRSVLFYVLVGIAGVWLPFLLSGVHATIAGVLVAFAIPARTQINEKEYVAKIDALNREFEKEIPNDTSLLTYHQNFLLQQIKSLTLLAETPLQKLEYVLHPWVAFLIMPLFALANAGIEINAGIVHAFDNPVTLGVAAGLIIGKFAGVMSFSAIMIGLGIASLPAHTSWKHMCGAALFAGIGFTMSLFVANLAFTEAALIDQAKYGIIFASSLAGIAGILVFKYWIKTSNIKA